MRRAVVQNLRLFRRPVSRKGVRASGPNVIFQRSIARVARPVHSQMQLIRRLSGPVAIGAAAAGLYYAYYETGTSTAVAAPAFTSRTQSTFTQSSPVVESAQVPEAVRKALIVDRGQLFTQQIPGDQPISKETDASGRKVLEMLTPEQVTARLRTNEESYLVHRGAGVVRYDVVQLPSNDPIEDDHVEQIVEVPAQAGGANTDWMFWGVFDGHSGWTTSAKLRQTLVAYVARELNETYKAGLSTSAESVDAAIKSGFVKLDNEIVHDSVTKVLQVKSKAVAAEMLAPALSGSCALLSFYDARSKQLRVACTGDSRAVLGRRSETGKWTATALSIDQTGGTPSEDARLRAEHPGEPYVTANGRILGSLEPSRAFGDAIYKWTKATQEKLKSSYFSRTPSKYLKTPPYVTAEPVISTTQIDPSKSDFMVMATDGLWEMLSNEEVVGLVGQWLDKQSASTTPPTSSNWLSWLSGNKPRLPVESANTGQGKGQRLPIRQEQWNVTPDQHDRFVVQDKNVATHLIRNALGGKDTDMVSALLTLPSPLSRRYRDDLTVQVIFFGENNNTGKVELNTEASATANNVADGQLKAKL